MSKHDTWVTLKAVNPLSEIIHLFPSQQVPMRDPFPMELAISESGNATLFTIDLDRLSSIQTIVITTTYATSDQKKSPIFMTVTRIQHRNK